MNGGMTTAIRLVGGVVGAIVGFQLASISIVSRVFPQLPARIGVATIVALIGWLLGPWIWKLFVRSMDWVLQGLANISLRDLALGAAGLIVGLIIAFLLGFVLRDIPYVGQFLRIAAGLVFGYLGIHVALQRREEVSSLLPGSTRGRGGNLRVKILDTSVIIDGRIADISKTRFLEGPLLVPRAVLAELQRIADSSDGVRRARGRRGLDVLNRLQKESAAVQVVDGPNVGEGDVDAALVSYAKSVGGCIVTNDFNLNKVAELQGVVVLNINELAQALRPILIPGESFSVHILKDGKEAGQGIGYLDDGTMVVVEGGKKLIGETTDVVVTSVLQTVAGRMIFARPRADMPTGSTLTPKR